MKTGIQSIDSQLVGFTNGSILATGSPNHFIFEMFKNAVKAGQTAFVLGKQTKKILGKQHPDLFVQSNVLTFPATPVPVGPFGMSVNYDDFVDYYGQNASNICSGLSNYQKVNAIFVYPDRPILSEDSAYATRLLANQHSPVIHWCNGPMGKIDESYFTQRGLKRAYDVHLHFEKVAELEYNVSITSFFNDSRKSGTHKVIIPKLKELWQIMDLETVRSHLFDFHSNPDDSRFAFGLLNAKNLLTRFRELTGRDRPGFMK